MIEALKTALKNNHVISLCINKVDWDKRIIGYIKSINGTTVIVDVVDIFGSVIKCKRVSIDRIVIVEIDDSYNKHLEKLKEQGNIIKKAKPLYYHNKGDNFIEKVELLLSKKSVCTFFFGTEYITGVVKKVNEKILFINAIGYRGSKEGKACFRLESVTKIRYDGPLEKKISYLQQRLS